LLNSRKIILYLEICRIQVLKVVFTKWP